MDFRLRVTGPEYYPATLSKYMKVRSANCAIKYKIVTIANITLPSGNLRLPQNKETFVDPATHDGARFKAANWPAVGRTAGLGRFAPADAPERSRKLIFVRSLGPAAGLDRDRWAALEFGGAPLGDVRLARRLVTCPTIQAEDPMDSIPGAAQGEGALVNGWYRFLDHPAESALTVENRQARHRERVPGRMQQQGVVLCVQDGTDLNFAEHGGCIGLGSIGRNKHSEGSCGMHLHSTLAVSEEGLPLGVLCMEFDAPEGLESPDPEGTAEKG